MKHKFLIGDQLFEVDSEDWKKNRLKISEEIQSKLKPVNLIIMATKGIQFLKSELESSK